MAARLSALRAGRTLPPGFFFSFFFLDSWCSFLLQAESTPGPEGLDKLEKKFTLPDANPRPFGLQA
jgi:hypothetical protein